MKRLYAYRCGTWAKDKGSSESARAPLEKIRAEGKFARRRKRRMKKKDEETDRRKSGREKRKEETEKIKRERKRGRNQEVKADRYSWTIQVAQQPAGSGTLSLLGPGSLEPVRLVSVFASIGSILRSSSVVHPSSTLFPFAFSFLFSLSLLLPAHPFDRVSVSLSSPMCLSSIGIFLLRPCCFPRPAIHLSIFLVLAVFGRIVGHCN